MSGIIQWAAPIFIFHSNFGFSKAKKEGHLNPNEQKLKSLEKSIDRWLWLQFLPPLFAILISANFASKVIKSSGYDDCYASSFLSGKYGDTTVNRYGIPLLVTAALSGPIATMSSYWYGRSLGNRNQESERLIQEAESLTP